MSFLRQDLSTRTSTEAHSKSSGRVAQDKSEPFDGLRVDSAKNLSGPSNNQILRRVAPQNDSQNQGFRMETN